MTEQEKARALKVALLLSVMEGWASPRVLAARLGFDVRDAVQWLLDRGWVTRGGGNVRWRGELTFEDLWGTLIPERPCPMRLRERTREPHTQLR